MSYEDQSEETPNLEKNICELLVKLTEFQTLIDEIDAEARVFRGIETAFEIRRLIRKFQERHPPCSKSI